MRPLLFDLYSCAGGAGMGYAQAGFDVIGFDIEPQPHYPFEFHQENALDVLVSLVVAGRWKNLRPDAIHASPPCQAWTMAQRIQKNDHPDLISPTRTLLQAINVPWVIENVETAPLIDPVLLCGAMFEELNVYRHRLFESNSTFVVPEHPEHRELQTKMGRPPRDGERMHVVGNFSGVSAAKRAMDINWMVRDELREAIPPAYTRYLGEQLLGEVLARSACRSA